MKREKQRYLVFEVIIENKPHTKQDIMSAVWNQFSWLFGEYGTSKAGLWLIYYDPVLKRGVIRCSLPSVDQVRVSLVTLRDIVVRTNGKEQEIPVIFHVLGKAGTILTVKRKYFHVPDLKTKKK